MCGIIGSISNKFVFTREHIGCLSHRGPDGQGYFCENNVMLGHKRLSIVDLSANGDQPMFSEDGNYVLIFNGEIFNHQDIRKKLHERGYNFRSTSDTETLLYGFVEFGYDIVKMLNGIFAFAIYDKTTQEVFIARDQFGIKPLYYYTVNGMFAFSSELKALRQIPHFDQKINITALFYYMQMLYAPGEMTPFQNIKKLLPGHYLVFNVKEQSYRCEQYYEISFHPTHQFSEQEWINRVDLGLQKAVERQLMSDVPLGYFLSGGLDSSLIVAMAAKYSPARSLKCFTIATGKDMENDGFANDEYYAKKVAKHLNADLEIVPAQISILDRFDEMIWHLDEPQADPAPLHVYNICRSARQQGIKVLLGGTAGDDLFSGYRRHQALNFEKYFKWIPGPVASLFNMAVSPLSSSNATVRRLKKITREMGQSGSQRMAGYFAWMPQDKVMDLFSENGKHHLNGQVLPADYWMQLADQLPEDTADLNKMLFLEMKTFLPDHNLNYIDKMSMANSVEARVPYLDVELVELAASMPVEMKMKGNVTKYVLKKVAEKYIPHDVIYRSKTGFGAPVRKWIKNDMQEMIDERLSVTSINNRGFFNAGKVQKMIDENKRGKIDASYTIWSLLAIESWMKQFENI